MLSSAGMTVEQPASASSAETKATATAEALRFTHGTSTSPATGSQTSPSRFWIADATAQDACAGVPPASSTIAAAAIAAAEPVSAWQPPSAPATDARFSITSPTAAAVNMLITTARSSQPSSSRIVSSAAGRMPQEPAVGAATMRPMAALSSETASAR